MNSRDRILAAVKTAQPERVDLPDISGLTTKSDASLNVNQFINTLQTIGGNCRTVTGYDDVLETVRYQFQDAGRMVSSIPELEAVAEIYTGNVNIESAENIDVAILQAHFGVGENGSVYLTENIMCDRVLPFICQHLVVILKAADIVADMHEAYERIATTDYGFSIFIAGPSKTADIEQSLVLGAHGPISMTVLILL